MGLHLVRREYVRLNDLLSHDRIIGDDDRRPRLELVSELVSKLGTETQSRFQRLGVDGATLTRHPHPTRFLVIWREPAGLSGGAFKHREDVIAELVAASEHSFFINL